MGLSPFPALNGVLRCHLGQSHFRKPLIESVREVDPTSWTLSNGHESRRKQAMKRVLAILIIIIMVISAMAKPLAGQKIERESSDRAQIIHLKTALNHLTVIELREPVVQVATGSQSFKVEWRENRVFVQPTQADASTNLFIWTASERLNYELEPAADVAGTDFAVDQIPLAQPKPASTPQ